MQALYETYKNDDFVVLAISLDRADIAFVKQFVAGQELTFPTLHDQSTGIGSAYGVRGVPSTFFIDHRGRVLGMVTGPRQWDSEDVDQLVRQLLEDIRRESAEK